MNTIRCHLAPRCALQVPVMRVGVPGEFHEDRWQRTAEDYERRVIPRTREAGGTTRIQVIAWLSVLQTALRHGHPAYRCLSGILAWRRGLLSALWHGDPAHRCLRYIPAWRRGLLSALWHGDPTHRYLSGILAWQRGSSGRSSARRPSTEALLGQGRVPKERESVPLTGL